MPDWKLWKEMAQDTLVDARSLFSNSRMRSAVSRYYYAVYQMSTAVLLYRNQTPPEYREAWSHNSTPELLGEHLHLSGLNRFQHKTLTKFMQELYKMRCDADYQSGVDFQFEIVKKIDRSARYFITVCSDILPKE